MQIMSVTKGMNILAICCNFNMFYALGFSLVLMSTFQTLAEGKTVKGCLFVACFAVGCLLEIETAILKIRLSRLVCIFKTVV